MKDDLVQYFIENSIYPDEEFYKAEEAEIKRLTVPKRDNIYDYYKEGEEMNAKELFEELGKRENAEKTEYDVVAQGKDGFALYVTYKYQESEKSIYITNQGNSAFSLNGRFDLKNMELLFQAISKAIEELTYKEG